MANESNGQKTTADHIADICERLMVSNEELFAGVQKALSLRGDDTQVDANAVVVESLRDSTSVSSIAGVWRITVRGASKGIVLKGLWNEDGKYSDLWGTSAGDVGEPFHWGREKNAYDAGELAGVKLQEGSVRLPDYYGALMSRDGFDQNRAGLFLEEVDGKSGKELTLTEFAVVAEQMGVMQGQALLDRLNGAKAPKWWAENYWSKYVERTEAMIVKNKSNPDFDTWWESELLQPFLEEDALGQTLRDRTEQLWNDRQEWLEVVEGLPTQTLSHNDFWPAQVMLESDGKTVVLDAASLGHAPTGADIAKLAVEIIACEVPSMDGIKSIERLLFDSYCEGLAKAGVDTNKPEVRQLVQLGWSSTLAAAAGRGRVLPAPCGLGFLRRW